MDRHKMPDVLYHGTSAEHLPLILKEGIKPRGTNGHNNWKHTVGSNKSAVYLTDAYGLHFAASATKWGHDAAILEIDTRALRSDCLVADEDVLEQVKRGHDDLPEEWDMKRRTIYYRSRAHLFSGLSTLAIMGTAGYKDTIIPEAIKRIAMIDGDALCRLTVQCFDPSITILNYKVLGERYRLGMKWIFGDVESFELFPGMKEACEAAGIERSTPLSREGIIITTRKEYQNER